MLGRHWIAMMLALSTAGCGETVLQQSPLVRGAQGESCRSRNDCEDGLSCIDNRCVDAQGNGGQAGDDGGTSMLDSRGKAGESCTRRADCQTGMACVDNVCGEESLTLPQGMTPSTRGDRGESCRARNDCRDGLACINSRCIENDYPLDVKPKECFLVQCSEEEDCCENFTVSVQCPTLQLSCTMGDQQSCLNYQALCVCPLACESNTCVTANRCNEDVDCGGVLRCFGGRCAQCEVSDDCLDGDDQCVAGVCRAGCQRNEQCPVFNECRSGQCVDVGCQSDRECYFHENDPRAVCTESACVIPCDNDAECNDFHLCEGGQCQFVGCETDEECRIFLGIANTPNSSQAMCRQPDN